MGMNLEDCHWFSPRTKGARPGGGHGAAPSREAGSPGPCGCGPGGACRVLAMEPSAAKGGLDAFDKDHQDGRLGSGTLIFIETVTLGAPPRCYGG